MKKWNNEKTEWMKMKKQHINTNSIDLIIQYFNYVIRCKLSNFFDREWFNYSYHTQAVSIVSPPTGVTT